MQRAVEAVYENGVLKPLERLDLEEGRHLALLVLDTVPEVPQENYRHLVTRDHAWRHQLYLKGRNLTVGQLVSNMRAEQLSPEQASERYDLPMEAIAEALAYYRSHRELIDAEADAEKQYLHEKGYQLEPKDLS